MTDEYDYDLLFLDPGAVTGWARLMGGVFSSGEVSSLRELGGIVQTHCQYRETPVICWERFDITPQTSQMKGSAAALEAIGVIRYLAERYRGQMLPPSSRQAKNGCPDAMLKAFGWYRPGHGGHANDAARHLVVWAIRNNAMPDSARVQLSQYLEEKDKQKES